MDNKHTLKLRQLLRPRSRKLRNLGVCIIKNCLPFIFIPLQMDTNTLQRRMYFSNWTYCSFIIKNMKNNRNIPSLNNLSRYSMGHNPTWEANSYSDGPEIPCALWNLHVPYHVHWPFFWAKWMQSKVFLTERMWHLSTSISVTSNTVFIKHMRQEHTSMHLTENVEICLVMGCELIINCHYFTLPAKSYTYEQECCKYSSFETKHRWGQSLFFSNVTAYREIIQVIKSTTFFPTLLRQPGNRLCIRIVQTNSSCQEKHPLLGVQLILVL